MGKWDQTASQMLDLRGWPDWLLFIGCRIKFRVGFLFGLFLVVVSCFKIPISTVKVVSLLELAIVREILKISFKKIYQLSRLWCLPLNLWTINIESEMCHHVFGYRQSVWNLSMDLLHIENSLSHVDWLIYFLLFVPLEFGLVLELGRSF